MRLIMRVTKEILCILFLRMRNMSNHGLVFNAKYARNKFCGICETNCKLSEEDACLRGLQRAIV